MPSHAKASKGGWEEVVKQKKKGGKGSSVPATKAVKAHPSKPSKPAKAAVPKPSKPATLLKPAAEPVETISNAEVEEVVAVPIEEELRKEEVVDVEVEAREEVSSGEMGYSSSFVPMSPDAVPVSPMSPMSPDGVPMGQQYFQPYECSYAEPDMSWNHQYYGAPYYPTNDQGFVEVPPADGYLHNQGFVEVTPEGYYPMNNHQGFVEVPMPGKGYYPNEQGFVGEAQQGGGWHQMQPTQLEFGAEDGSLPQTPTSPTMHEAPQPTPEPTPPPSPPRPIHEDPQPISPVHTPVKVINNSQPGDDHPCLVLPTGCSKDEKHTRDGVCMFSKLPRSWCIYCLTGVDHDDCTGTKPELHPCIRVWGKCKYNDTCIFKQFPRCWCLYCCRGSLHLYCDGVTPLHTPKLPHTVRDKVQDHERETRQKRVWPSSRSSPRSRQSRDRRYSGSGFRGFAGGKVKDPEPAPQPTWSHNPYEIAPESPTKSEAE